MALTVGSSALKLGCWLDDLKLGIREGLKRAAQSRCDAVGVDVFSTEISPRGLSQSGRKDLARLIRNANVSLAAAKADVGGRRLGDPKSVDVTLAKIREAFELARDLGAVRILVPLGFIPDEKEEAAPRLETSSASIFAIPTQAKKVETPTSLSTLQEAARAIASFGSNLGVRPCVLSSAEPVERLEKFLQSADPGHLIEIDLNPGAWTAKGEDPSKVLFALNTRIGIATAIDHYKGGAEAAFGSGDVAWPELVVGLSSLSRPEPVTMLAGCQRDCDRAQALGAALVKLGQLRLNPLG